MNDNKIEKKEMDFSLSKLLLASVMLIVLVAGATFALLGVSVSNGHYAYETTCFDVVYDTGEDITGTLFPSSGPSGGLNGALTIGIDQSCGVNVTGNFYLTADSSSSGGSKLIEVVGGHCENKTTLETVSEYTDEATCTSSEDNIWVTTGTALKYAVYLSSEIDNPLSVGYIDKLGEAINIYGDFDISSSTQYVIYIWLDGELADNSYANLSFSGGISAEVIQGIDDYVKIITSYICNYGTENEVIVGDNPYFTYTGDCKVVDDGDGNWRIKFLSDGTFISTVDLNIDVFLVGGGGGGGTDSGGGGGGGYTTTQKAIVVDGEASNLITIGSGGSSGGGSGGSTSAFDFKADGGGGGGSSSNGHGGSGGSGGGGYASSSGGSDGSNGTNGTYYSTTTKGGTGQGTTTREFGEQSGDLYAGGGGGGSPSSSGGTGGSGGGGTGGAYSGSKEGNSGETNTGGGGGGGALGTSGGAGGSGIVVIRNSILGCRSGDTLEISDEFTYTGNCETIDDGDGNWRIKFLSDGTFVSTVDLNIDVFLVGGGGGGGTDSGGGGGGGYTTTQNNIIVNANTSYSFIVGLGGVSGGGAGGITSAFEFKVDGGGGGGSSSNGHGGSGGSGGGGYASSSGGSDGSNGTNGTYYSTTTKGGTGQGTTTREFGESTGTLYAGGGGGGSQSSSGGTGGSGGGGTGGAYSGSKKGNSGETNTGGGGGGGALGTSGGAGGSGIVVIRNIR